MKDKLLGSINYILAAISGIVTIVLLCLPIISYFRNVDILYDGVKNIGSFEMVSGNFANHEYFNNGRVATLSGIFAIVTTVIAAILIIVCIMMLLKKLGVFDWKLDSKVKDFNFILNTVATLLAVLAFGVFLCALFFTTSNAEVLTFSPLKLTPIAYALFAVPAGIAILMWIVDAVLESKAKKAA